MGSEDDKKQIYSNDNKQNLEKYLKYKIKYLKIKKSLNFQDGGANHNKIEIWRDENNWKNKGSFNKCIEISNKIGDPNYISHDKNNKMEFVKWQQLLDNDNFEYGYFKGVDMIKITDYTPKKLHPYVASVYVIVGKFIHVPNHLLGPLKYASETINIEQLSVPKKINDKYINENIKELSLVTGSCASVTISAITIKFAEDLIEKYKNYNFNNINEKVYEEFRDEYDKRVANYLCGEGIKPKIPWLNPKDFNENPKMGQIKACNN